MVRFGLDFFSSSFVSFLGARTHRSMQYEWEGEREGERSLAIRFNQWIIKFIYDFRCISRWRNAEAMTTTTPINPEFEFLDKNRMRRGDMVVLVTGADFNVYCLWRLWHRRRRRRDSFIAIQPTEWTWTLTLIFVFVSSTCLSFKWVTAAGDGCRMPMTTPNRHTEN